MKTKRSEGVDHVQEARKRSKRQPEPHAVVSNDLTNSMAKWRDIVEELTGDFKPHFKQPSNDNPPRASLLGLPAELRNEIYRLVLIVGDRKKPEGYIATDQMVDINANHGLQPGILRCCRQTRQEAAEIFLRENRFYLTFHDLKFAPRISHWCWTSGLPRVEWALAGSYSWANFKHWLLLVHSGRAHPLPRAYPIRPADTYSVLWRAFQIVNHFIEGRRQGRTVAWVEIEGVLEIYRDAIDDRPMGRFFDD